MAVFLARVIGCRVASSCTPLWGALPVARVPVTEAISKPELLSRALLALSGTQQRYDIHTSAARNWEKPTGPRKWLRHNKTKFPPTPLDEEQRHAYVCHMKKNIKYSPKKMWYIAVLVRGLRIDDAINQLKFVHKKGSVAARETLEEARDLAVRDHNVEFPSNLWVSESFTTKGMVIKGYRRHARRRFGHVKYKYCHYYVTLEEGDPPPREHFYWHTRPLSPHEMLQEWIENLRKREFNVKEVRFDK